jgi:hypothetical protein
MQMYEVTKTVEYTYLLVAESQEKALELIHEDNDELVLADEATIKQMTAKPDDLISDSTLVWEFQ